MLRRIEIFFSIPGKLAERSGSRRYGLAEAADPGFILVTDVQHQCTRTGDDCVPVLRLYVPAAEFYRINVLYAQGDDFLLDLYLHAVKRAFSGAGFLMNEVRKTGFRTEAVQDAVYSLPAACDSAVNALGRQQEGPLEPESETTLQQGLLQFPEIRQPDKLVERGHNEAVIPCAHIFSSDARTAAFPIPNS